MRGQVEAGGLRLPGISFLFKIHCRHKSLRMIAITIVIDRPSQASCAKYIAAPQG